LSATIKDVARLAGCSIKTVSRVINNEPHVTDDLRIRVQAAIRTAGYSPNISARRLVQNKSYMICILMYPGYDQSAADLLPRIMDIGYEENYDILVQPYFPTHSRSKNKLVALIGGRRMDGFVSTPPCDADGFVADLLTTYKVPLVQIDPFDRSQNVPYVAGDDFQGAYSMTEYLIKLGHRRIAFLMGPRNLRSSFDRLEGYQAALETHRIGYGETLVEPCEFTFDGGYTATRLLLERNPKPGAIFAGNDTAAYGAIYAAQESGLTVPHQLSIGGYADLALSKHIWPGLTTVHQPAEEMLEKATRLLIDILKGKTPEQTQFVLPSHLVVRGSTAAPENEK
jgi:LacI family transcriptional regulator